MSDKTPEKISNPARRHFIAAVSSAGARIAALAAVAGIAQTTSASAKSGGISKSFQGTGHLPGGGGGGGGGGGAGGGAGGAGGGGGGGGGAVQCFLRGTHVLTDRGEVAVEALKAGDLVQTLDGGRAPIKWIGRRSFRSSGRDWPADIKPIRIARSAIADGVPYRDLYVSPWHFLYFDGHLMPAKDLVNGVTIVAALPEDAAAVEYFHILLDSHDVILAEGVAAETLLLKAGDHEYFSNFAEYERLVGADAVDMTPCAPRVWYSGGRSHLAALARLGASNFVDVRDPIQKVNRRLAARARAMAPALAA